MADKLKPCPFCGGNNVELYSPPLSRLVAVHCLDCEIQGEKAISEQNAIAAWNTRTPLITEQESQ